MPCLGISIGILVGRLDYGLARRQVGRMSVRLGLRDGLRGGAVVSGCLEVTQ
jgi:hypothetical protein